MRDAADNVDITAGFIRDASLNAVTTDADQSFANLFDNVAPTISSFSTTADGSYGIGDTVNITATSETVLGSAITATLSNNVNVV